MQSDYSRKTSDTAHERCEIVIAPYNFYLNGKLNIKLLNYLWLKFNFLKLQPTPKPSSCYVLQQPRNLGIARQLPQKRTK